MEVPIDRFILPKDLQAMLEVFFKGVILVSFPYC